MERPKPGFLNEKERELLITLHRKEKQRKIGDRIKIVLLLDKGWSYEKVAEALFLEHKTPMRKYEDYIKRGVDGLLDKCFKGRTPYLSNEQTEQLQIHIEEHIYHSVKEVAAYIKANFGVDYKPKGVTELLKRLGFVYKKPKLVPGKADAVEQRKFLERYEKMRKNQNPAEVTLFMDGAHPQHNAQPAYGWIKKGVEKELKSNTGRKRLNLNGVWNPDKLEAILRSDETIDADSTVKLFEKIELHYPEAKSITIVCDNARYYRSKKVSEHLKSSKIQLMFLPPYSPNLNLIERLWRFMHKKVTYNKYYEKFKDFEKGLLGFFERLEEYRDELAPLMIEKFHIMNPQTQTV